MGSKRSSEIGSFDDIQTKYNQTYELVIEKEKGLRGTTRSWLSLDYEISKQLSWRAAKEEKLIIEQIYQR